MFLKFSFDDANINFKIIKEIFIISLPIFVDSSILLLISSTLNIVLLDYISANVLATYVVIQKIQRLINVPTFSMGRALTIITSHLNGAGKFDLLDEVFKYGLKIGILILMICSAIFLIFHYPITCLFTRDSAIIDIIFQMFIFLIPPTIFMVMVTITSYFFNGFGKSYIPLFLNFLTFTFILIFTYVFVINGGLGELGFYLTLLVSEILIFIIALYFVSYVIKKKKLNHKY